VDDCTGRLEARWPTAKLLYFGHIADSNIHIAVQTEERPLPEAQIDELVYKAVRDFKDRSRPNTASASSSARISASRAARSNLR